MATETATVQVLTAEVRVLMVGSRQITLSVFRQLDIVRYGECVPMGRVNEGSKWLIGKGEDGSLVRAQFDWEYPKWSVDDGLTLKWLRGKRVRGEVLSTGERDRLIELEDTVGHLEEWQAEYKAEAAKYRELPLIVLAGLK